MWTSVPQIDVFLTRIRTSLMPGVGTETSVNCNPGPARSLAMARIFFDRMAGRHATHDAARNKPACGHSATAPQLLGEELGALKREQPHLCGHTTRTGEPGHLPGRGEDPVTRNQ